MLTGEWRILNGDCGDELNRVKDDKIVWDININFE